MKHWEKYIVCEADLFDIRNRNEVRVAECIREVLMESGETVVDAKMVQDTFALALNHLPARYAQPGTIILRDPVRKEDIRAAVLTALDRVKKNPKP